MITKVFGDKRIIIRELNKNDLRKVKKFQDFINSLAKEDAKILINRKVPIKEEVAWLKSQYDAVKTKKLIHFLTEHNDKIVGSSEIRLHQGRMSHVGEFGIAIRNGYRRMGLGTYLAKEIIKLAQKRFKIKIVRLSVYSVNKPARELYNSLGFKMVATIPKQIQIKGKLKDEVIMIRELK